MVWYIHGYEVFEENSESIFTGHQMMEAVGPGQIVCSSFRLHGPITGKTTISILDVMHFSCFVSLYYK